VKGADVVFATTTFNEAFIRASASDLEKLSPGQTLREWCYELEVQQGKNIADAVATVQGLELFIWSSLSDAAKWSGGKYKGVLHFDSKAHVENYIHTKYPRLAEKMSILQLGLFVTNWKWGQGAVPWENVSLLLPLTPATFMGSPTLLSDELRGICLLIWRICRRRTTHPSSASQEQATCRSPS
jgi:NmrA-like family